tara:strand:- start:1642 stop:1749 length:108 start_codon:yes stop_codon:yes gene_type:complete
MESNDLTFSIIVRDSLYAGAIIDIVGANGDAKILV